MAESVTGYSLKMPEEYINYTISNVSGKLWAKVDGIYPISKIEISTSNYSDLIGSYPVFYGDILQMSYPTPPGTTNISVKLNETELNWSNYTQTFPEAVHYTSIGDWPMIECLIDPIVDDFTLKIHYEHPIMTLNESYCFLYDLNISPYLSPWSNKSTAYFNINFEENITDFKATTIAIDGSIKEIEYTLEQESTETVSLNIISEFSKPLLGDLLITFIEDPDENQSVTNISNLNISREHYYAIFGMIAIIAATLGYLLESRKFLRKK